MAEKVQGTKNTFSPPASPSYAGRTLTGDPSAASCFTKPAMPPNCRRAASICGVKAHVPSSSSGCSPRKAAMNSSASAADSILLCACPAEANQQTVSVMTRARIAEITFFIKTPLPIPKRSASRFSEESSLPIRTVTRSACTPTKSSHKPILLREFVSLHLSLTGIISYPHRNFQSAGKKGCVKNTEGRTV